MVLQSKKYVKCESFARGGEQFAVILADIRCFLNFLVKIESKAIRIQYFITQQTVKKSKHNF